MKIPGFVKHFVFMIPYWLIAMVCYYIFRFYGLEQTPGITVNLPEQFMPGIDFIFFRVGIAAALIYTLVETIGDTPIIKNRPLGIVLLVKGLASFALLLGLSYVLVRIIGLDNGGRSPLHFKPFLSFVFYFSMMSLLASFIKLMISKFGRGQFIRIVLGRYREPREEKRIF